MRVELLAFVLIINVALISGNSRYCVDQVDCEKCLDQHFSCAWCSDKQYDMRRSRCMTEKDLKDANCRGEFIEINKFSPPNITKENDLRDFHKDSEPIQIKPQNVHMKLRKNRPQTVKLKYRPAKNYPLDLYLLMDLTYSMRDDKETLVKMGGSLSKSLKDLTENFRLGFGSFADKPILPFMQPGTEDNPCKLVQDTCLPTYAFKHKLSFTENVEQFISKVNDSDITANLDNLEGTFDALMQILVCRNEIGWGEKTRKIIILASDGLIHFAGDGLLAGIVQRNDKKCHLNNKGDYVGSLDYDYPSLEEIYRELLKTKVSVIFAVTSEVIFHYDQMHEIMSEITSVGQLAADSSNILQLVEQGFKDAIKRAQFQDNAPDYIKVEYKTKCGDKFDTPQYTNKCDNIEIGKEYEFDVILTLQKYPEDGTKNLKIKIEESNIDSESVEVDVEIDLPCLDCNADIEINSTLCEQHGTFQCGSCVCLKGYIGPQCDCNLQEYSSSKELDNLCRNKVADNQNSQLCSDRGECLCGQCYCNVLYSGKYCECDSCPIDDNSGLECSGSQHGFCDCGICQCHPEFSGTACECSTLETNCISPDSKMSDTNKNKVCSGHGKCKCNKCDCETGHFGQFCESTPGNETFNSLCIFYETCVQCIIKRKLGQECSDYKENCSPNDSGALYKSEFYDDISDAKIVCISRVRYDDDTICEYKFTYDLDENQETNFRIENTKCPPTNVAAISIIGVIIATFLLGLFIICLCRLNMWLADRREYRAFEAERQKTTYKYESPLYKSPVTHFKNPNSPEHRPNNVFELR